MADPITAAILAAVRDALPANDRPAWVTLASEAQRRGHSTTAFRRWCERHGVQIRQESHRDAWVSPAEVDRAVEGLPLAIGPTAEETPERKQLRSMGLGRR